MSGRNVVAQEWPIAGGGHVTLILSTPAPDSLAITHLAPIVTAIREYQHLLAATKHPLQSAENPRG